MNNNNLKNNGKELINNFYTMRLLVVFFALGALFVSCDNDDDDNAVGPNDNNDKFTALEAPYLVCANRNPGGVGFDFEYKGKKGGANNMDKLSVKDFDADIVFRTLAAQKPNSTDLGGAPFIKLSDGVAAINYSAVKPECVGKAKFAALTQADVGNELALKADDASFSLENIAKGSTGKPEMKELKKEYQKLVIGDKWRVSANDQTPDNEIIWVIRSKEGKMIKFIVTEFPAKNAATARGYVNIEWDFLK